MSHTAELIAVGTELLLGNIANTDAQMISQGLSQLGINVYYHTVVGDNPQRVRQAVDIARGRADILITTGGLGPTCDDLTKVAVAQAFGKELVYHEPSAQRIRERFAARGTPVTENNFQQAMVPEGCTVLDNDWGTAPGVAFVSGGTHVLMLPGPPRECEKMFRHRALPYLQKLSDGVIASRTVKTFGIGESAAEALLRDLMNALHNPTLAPYAKPTGTELRITAHAPTREEALRLIAPVEEQVKAILKDKVIGVDVDSLEDGLPPPAEGAGAHRGHRRVLHRGADGQAPHRPARLLRGVPGGRGELHRRREAGPAGGAGGPAGPARRRLPPRWPRPWPRGPAPPWGCDLALAATGVAGPDPDDRGNPIGLVYLALAWEGGCQVVPFRAGTQAERERVRRMAAWTGLDLIRRHLTGLPLA